MIQIIRMRSRLWWMLYDNCSKFDFVNVVNDEVWLTDNLGSCSLFRPGGTVEAAMEIIGIGIFIVGYDNDDDDDGYDDDDDDDDKI